MYYVVDQWGKTIREFNDREDANQFCESWNEKFRFSGWIGPKAQVIEGGVTPPLPILFRCLTPKTDLVATLIIVSSRGDKPQRKEKRL